MMKNVQRKAILLRDLPMQTPRTSRSTRSSRWRMSLLPLDTPMRHKLIDALFAAVWCRSLHVSETAVAERVAIELGLPGAKLVAQASQPEIKSQLTAGRPISTHIKRGVFGVPNDGSGR